MSLNLFSDATREPAECIVTIDGEEMADLYPFLSGLTVETSRNQAAVATLQFESRRDENGQWSVQDAGILRTWAAIVIEAAFGDTTEEIMRGFIREINADYPEDGNAIVTVECQDESISLDRQHRRKNWGGDAATTDEEIVREILSGYALSPHMDNGSGQSSIVVNQDEPDASFLRKRAEANGYELVFNQGEVYFGPWRVDAEPQATIMVYAGSATNCNSFTVENDGHQPDAVSFDTAFSEGDGVNSNTITSDLPLMGTETADSSSSGLGDFVWTMSREGIQDEVAATALAQKKANELSMKIKAKGVLDGTVYGRVLRVAEPVGVDGVGDWLGGIYYVDAVSHKFDHTGYTQGFELMRNAFGDNLDSGGSVLSAIL